MSVSFDGIEYHLTEQPPDNAEESIQFLLCRLIAGKIKLIKGEKTVRQPFDYSELPYKKQSAKPEKVIPLLLNSEGFEVDVKDFIKNTRSDNRDFFREILAEFSNFFIQTTRGNHTTAFFAHIQNTGAFFLFSSTALFKNAERLLGDIQIIKRNTKR